MATKDFTLSFTITQLLTWIEHGEGQVGGTSTIFADITSFEQVGGTTTKNTSAIAQIVNGLSSDIIHYNDSAKIMADELILRREVRPELLGASNVRWLGNKRQVIDHAIDATLDFNESNSVNINTSAAGDLAVTLPADSLNGIKYTFVKTSSSGTFTVKPSTAEFLTSSGVLATGIILDSFGSKLSVVSDGRPNSWVVVNSQSITELTVSAPFSPGLALWLDADDASTITTVGSDVSEWRDKSGNGRDFVQATPGDRPELIAAAINGLPGIQFANGTTEHLSRSSDLIQGNVGEVFAIVFLDVSDTDQAIFSLVDTITDINPSVNLFARRASSAQAGPFHRGDAGVTSSAQGDTLLSTATAYMLSYNNAGGSWSVRVNQHDEVLTVSGTDGLWFGDDSAGADSMIVGANELGTIGVLQNLKGKIGELLIYDGIELTATERGNIEAYLISKWGI